MSVKNKVQAITASVINVNTFTGIFLPINPAGLPEACFSLHIVNDSDQKIAISFDGINEQVIMIEDSEREFSFQNFSQPNNQVCLMPAGTVVWVKGLVGTGFVSLSGFYQI